MDEAKIVFWNGQEVRAIRGQIEDEGPDYVTVRRMDGTWKISNRFIVSIEYPAEGGGP